MGARYWLAAALALSLPAQVSMSEVREVPQIPTLQRVVSTAPELDREKARKFMKEMNALPAKIQAEMKKSPDLLSGI
jgi:hypothetical protein